MTKRALQKILTFFVVLSVITNISVAFAVTSDGIRPKIATKHSLIGQKRVTSVVFSPDGKLLASGGGQVYLTQKRNFFGGGMAESGGTIKIWNAATGDLISTLQGPEHHYARALAFSPDNKKIASVHWPIIIWDVKTGKKLKSIDVQASGGMCVDGSVVSVAFSPNGKILATGHDICGNKSNIIFWDVATGQKIKTITRGAGTFRSIVFNSDGSKILAGRDSEIAFYDISNDELQFSIKSRNVNSVVFSSDGKIIIAASENDIDFYDAVTGTKLRNIHMHGEGGEITSIAISPDGKILASGRSRPYDVKLWDVETGEEITTLTEHPQAVRSVAFSPVGNKLASGCGDVPNKGEEPALILWDLDRSAINSVLVENKEKLVAAEKDRSEKERIEKERKDAEEKRLSQIKDDIMKICNGKMLSLADFLLGNNPHADKGKCVSIIAQNHQMTSERTGLFELGNNLAYIEFPNTFRGLMVYGVAKVKGVYSYKTVSGTYNNVPHLRIIKELSENELSVLKMF